MSIISPLPSSATDGSLVNPTAIMTDLNQIVSQVNANAAPLAGVGTVTNIATGTGLTGGPITTTGTISMVSTIIAGGPTGGAATVPVITYNAEGQLTAVSTASITPAAIGAPAGSGTSTGSNTGDQNLSGLVPYSGASGSVDLGANTFSAEGIFQKQSVDNGVTLTVPSGYSMVVAGNFTVTGDLVVNGDMRVM